MPRSSAHARRIAECYDVAHEVFATINRDAGPELLSLDLTMGQFKALMTVTMFGPQPVGALGRHLGLSEPGACLLVDKLEEHGFAVRERDPRDGRRSLVTLTPAAVELAATLRQGREEHIERWLGTLATDELEGLLRGFRGLLRVAETTTEDAAAQAAGARDEAHLG